MLKLESDDNEKIKKSLGLKIDSNLKIRNYNNKIIVPKELKLKCQLKWDTFYEKKFNWIAIWYNIQFFVFLLFKHFLG
jgi:hypothetical protein